MLIEVEFAFMHSEWSVCVQRECPSYTIKFHYVLSWCIIIVTTDEAEPPVQIASRPAPRGASHLTHLETGPTASLVPQVSETSPPMRFSAAPDVR